MLSGDYEPRFSVKNMLKDLQIALRATEGKGIPLPVTAATAGALMGAVQSGWGEDDFASLSRHYAYAPHRAESRPPSDHPAVTETAGEQLPVKESGGKSLFGFFRRSKKG
jgi:hypothetical protein